MSGVELCDFFWQHEHNKKWISYSDEELSVLNKAVKRGQKTVSLPSNTAKKQIVVNFEKMYQKNTVSLYEQRVRCAVYTDDFHAWMWKDDDGQFSSYTPRLVLFLEKAYLTKQKKVKFYFRGDYELNLETLSQVNLETNYSRPAIREKVEVSDPKSEIIISITSNSKDHMDKLCSRDES
ncbi:uncharacterized protein LOC129231649 [Uloborus diversus]|uniref:uncharacterized protein LOC129231649 n=1 Tax=Uloborus diversus TaxID=327109 RepID=UPI00240A7DE9|nr:uncharacterized protein LOC129231649 [Uloborus diversus]